LCATEAHATKQAEVLPSYQAATTAVDTQLTQPAVVTQPSGAFRIDTT
jgi:hypothetical protein